MILAAAAVDMRLFVFPERDLSPTHADAIVVYGGPGERTERAWELADQGHASTVVVSVPDPRSCTHERATVVELCYTPDPATTRGEAQAVAAMARDRGWNDLIIVAGTTQVTRLRLRQGRCFDGNLQVVAVREPLGPFLYRWVYEHGALVKALVLQRSC